LLKKSRLDILLIFEKLYQPALRADKKPLRSVLRSVFLFLVLKLDFIEAGN
jgi:hypothetical protein